MATHLRTWSMAAATVLAVATACTGAPSPAGSPSEAPSSRGSPSPAASPTFQQVTDYSSFIQELKGAGSDIREGERTGGDHLFGPGRSVFIDGVRVSTYEFPSERALDEFRDSVSEDGYSIPTRGGGVAIVEWVKPPHFHAAGTLLVLYFGHEQRTLDVLALLMGRAFAGETVS